MNIQLNFFPQSAWHHNTSTAPDILTIQLTHIYVCPVKQALFAFILVIGKLRAKAKPIDPKQQMQSSLYFLW